MKRNPKDYILLSLKGVVMGAADMIPGVSGGTIAFITGIYEELINSIKSVNLNALKLLFSFKIKELWKAVNGNFLISILLGITISIFSLAKVMQYLLNHHPILVWSFFFGLVAASVIFVARSIEKWDFATVIAGIAGTVSAYAITVISPAEANTTWFFIFISGTIAICAMIMPGISGSFILVLMGMYKFILGAVSDLNIPVMLVFIAGAVIGIIAFSNLLSWLLKKYHNVTIALLTGFMIGSLNKVWPWKQITETFTDRHGELRPLAERNIFPKTYETITGNESFLIGAIALAVTGFVLIFIIEGLTKQKK